MKKLLVISIFVLMIPFTTYSQLESNLDSLIIQGKKQLHSSLHKWTESDLLNSRAYFERLLISQPDSWLVHYYIGFADSRLVSFYFSQNNKENAKNYIDDGIKHLRLVIEKKVDFAEAHSLLSSLYGNKIGTNPMLGMTLGPKSGIEMGKAMSLQPKNPRNYLIAGWSTFFTPKIFGGGKKKAKKKFEQAIAYFDSFKVNHPTLPDWGKEEAYAWLGQVNTEFKEFEAAELNFKKALKIKPDYGWVLHVLLPDLKKKVSEEKK
jgi:tetratricopeptide (TPR) repeat protein